MRMLARSMKPPLQQNLLRPLHLTIPRRTQPTTRRQRLSRKQKPKPDSNNKAPLAQAIGAFLIEYGRETPLRKLWEYVKYVTE